MRGNGGEVRIANGARGWLSVGWREAADLRDWVITRDGTQFVCRATAVDENSRVEERPIDLKVEIGPMTWIWKAVEPIRRDGKVTVALSHGPDVVRGMGEDSNG